MATRLGRPTKYLSKYCDEIVTFFEREPYREVEVVHTNKDGSKWSTFEDKPNDLPFLSDFAHSIGVNSDTLVEWSKVHAEFSVAYKKAKALQESMLATNGLRGLYAQPFAIFTAKNIAGWRDRTETDITTKGKELPTPILGGMAKADVRINDSDS